MADAGLDVEVVNKVLEGRPHVVDMLKSDQIQFVVNTTEGRQAINDWPRSVRLHWLTRFATPRRCPAVKPWSVV